MSNILYIEKTEFKRGNSTTYGFCIYDDYAKDYMNTLSKEEFDNLTDDEEIYYIVYDEFGDFFDDLEVFSNIYINDKTVLENCDECNSTFLYWDVESRMFEDEVGNGLTEFNVCPNCKSKL